MRRIALVSLLGLALLGPGASAGSRLLRVAYVTDVSTAPGPHDLRGSALLGFQRAVGKFRVQPRVVQFDPRSGPGPIVTSLARQKYDLVLMGEVQSAYDIEAVLSVARRFPHVRFVLVDPPVVVPWPKNVEGPIWRVEEPAYLAGYLAGLEEKARPGSDAVGSVGGYRIPTVDAFIAGFEAGAHRAGPGIRTLHGYTFDFFDQDKCRRVARRLVAQGAGVLFNVAGACGLGTLQEARKAEVWGVGVDVDQSYLGPQILTSVLKRFDVMVYATIDAFVHGRLKTGGNAVWSVRNGAVGLGRISPRVPRSLVRKVERIREQIAAGRIRVPSALR